jgi:thiosulfate dehydrogenase (quinone) large subunit
MTAVSLGRSHQVALVLLRTLIGWHFAYEGYFKLLHPAWSRAGEPLERFSAAGYLQNATGPFAELFQALARPALIPYVDTGVAIALLLIGVLLMLGLLTQLACTGALLLLTLFYVSAIPLTGLPQPRNEGAYLVVNKNLIELAAVAVLLTFRTGRIAGLDSLRRSRVRTRPAATSV